MSWQGLVVLLCSQVPLSCFIGFVAYRVGYRRGQGEYLRRLQAAGSRFADPTFVPSTAGLESHE